MKLIAISPYAITISKYKRIKQLSNATLVLLLSLSDMIFLCTSVVLLFSPHAKKYKAHRGRGSKHNTTAMIQTATPHLIELLSKQFRPSAHFFKLRGQIFSRNRQFQGCLK